jgi:HSP20 family protein
METNTPNGNGGSQAQATRGKAPQPQENTQSTQENTRQSRQAVTGSQESGQDRSRSMSRRNSGELSRSSHDPWQTMTRLSREMDQLFDSFFGNRFGFPRLARGWPFESGAAGGGSDLSSLWTPNVDVRRRGDSVVIHAELAGVSKDAVRIEATDQGIAISGERSETREEGGNERGYQLKERSYGTFYREIPLPEGAQVEQAKATMRDGVLEVTVPLQENQTRRQIRIE